MVIWHGSTAQAAVGRRGARGGEMLEAALELAARGWPVFPLVAGGKVPLLSVDMGGRGVHDATCNPEKIGRLWSHYPSANIGLATGPKAGIFVVDIDAGKGGSLTMAELVKLHGRLPETLVSRTGNGWHYFYKLPATAVRQGVNVLGPGVDTRASGGYVVAPPSVHPSGRRYEWLAQREPAPCPAWIARMVLPPAPPLPPPLPPRADGGDVVDRARRYLARMEPSISGQRGHDRLFWACVCMVRGFGLSFDEAVSLVLSEFSPRCQPPWSEKEVRHKVRSAEQARRPLGFLLDAPRRRAA